jgi:hypothetical protein
MTACLNCQKEVVPKEGKRTKKFCSDACRATYYQKHKPKGPSRYVLRTTHEKAVEALTKELKELKDKVRWASEPLVPRVVKADPFVDPLLEEALSRPPKPLPQAIAALRSFQDLLRIAPTITDRKEREAFALEVKNHPNLTPGQRTAIHTKLPKLP